LQKQIEKLSRENREIKSQMVHQYHFASKELNKFTEANYMGSAVILELTGLGGKTKLGPVAIRDGLSQETIESLKKRFSKIIQSHH